MVPPGAPILKFRSLSPPLRGMVWMLFSVCAFVAMVAMVRHASQRFTALDIAFWRAFFSLVLMAPLFLRGGLHRLYTPCLKLHILRNLFHFAGIATWFYALSRINLSLGTSLQFTVPLFTIALAMLVLGERMDAPRVIATVVGFSGVLLALRPGIAEVDPIALLVLGSAFCYAVPNIFTKLIARTDTSDLVVFYMNLMHLPLALAGALMLGFTLPGVGDLPWLFGIAAAGTLAHYLLAQALRQTDAGHVMAIDFLKLPLTSLFAYLIFAETPDAWSWAGGSVIFAATYYIVRREAVRARPM